MKILYLGDIMGMPGRKVISKLLPKIRIQHDVDVVIAQAENATHGKGLSQRHYVELEEAGIDGFTGGNHTFERKDTIELVKNELLPIVAPANVKGDTFGNYKLIKTDAGVVAIASILGYIAPGGYDDEITANPLVAVDEILLEIKKSKPAAIVINIHSEFSSEKVIMGHYLDGQVTAVVGDHWHVPTADARVLPKGTAHITDVGMCGSLNSSIGVELNGVIDRWKGGKTKNVIDTQPPWQLNGLLIETDNGSGLAKNAKLIQVYTDTL